MTHNHPTVPAVPPDDGAPGCEQSPARDVEAALELVRSNALQLLSGFTRAPSVLRIRAGGVTVEAEWPAEPAATLAGPPTAPNGSGVPPVATGDEPVGHRVCAPAVGVLFHAPAPGADPFVSVGDSVAPGQQLAIIEVMKLMIPVEADVHGTVTAVLKDNGQPVEYDEPLFAIEPRTAG